jgi:glyoxylase-like metal-dependent hydrolase (beta-lactamase superfamily II)
MRAVSESSIDPLASSLVVRPITSDDRCMTTIHTHTTDEAGFAVNSYLVESREAVLAVDAPFLLSDARNFRAQLDAIGKPLAGVLITHAHPDHVNGIATLVAGLGEVPILATAGVDRVHREIDGPKRAQWTPVYGDNYPAEPMFANRLVADGERIELGGVALTVRDLGPGESPSASAWILGPRVFIGDLAYSDVHPYLLEPDAPAWLAQLDRARALFQGEVTLLPGHGLPGGLELLDRQQIYLETYLEAVAELQRDGRLDQAAVTELERRMDRLVPGGPLRMLVALGAEPVAATLVTAMAG